MSKHYGITKTTCVTTLLVLMAMVAGCGSDDNKKKQQNNCFDNIVYFALCAFSSSTDDPNASGKPSTDSGVTSATLPMTSVAEFEPNNVLDNANIVTFPGASTASSSAVEFRGSVQAAHDASDYFIFTPSRSGTHRLFLCAETCAESREDDAAYIMIYNQNQTTIASTPVGTMSLQEITAELTAGFAYYVEINGYNVGEEDYDYRLAIVD
jgi:hypothetical protein